jgi:hypothetical protein
MSEYRAQTLAIYGQEVMPGLHAPVRRPGPAMNRNIDPDMEMIEDLGLTTDFDVI